MEHPINPLHARLRLAGLLIIAGLFVQTISLLWNHPLSFIAFVTIGGLLMGAGIILYLITLVSIPANNAEGVSPKSADSQP